MATILDAFVVEVGLDASKFQKGQRAATEAFAKTKESALKSGKSIEESSDKAALALAKVARQALELYAVFLGGRGIAQFISDITAGDAALGRFSGTLNESPRTIAAWGLAVEEIGGSSAATAASFRSLSDKIEDLRMRGKALPDTFYQLQAAGGRTIDLNHGVAKSMIDIAANLKAVAAHDQAKAGWLGRQLGIDEDTVNRMIQDGAKIGDVIEKFMRKGPSEKDIKSAQALQKAWADLSQEAEHIGRSILNSISPALIDAMTRFDEWIAKKENQKEFNDAIKQLSDWIDKIDWPGIEKGVKEFAAGADAAAQAVGGWKVVGEGLFGVWAVSKLAGIATGVMAIVLALRAAATAAAALALNPIVAAAGVLLSSTTPLNEGENELERQKKYGRDKHDAPDAAPPATHIPTAPAPGAEPPKSKGLWERLNELFGVSGAHAEGVQQEGRPVGRGNPLAVMVTNGGGDQSSGRGIGGSTGPGSGGNSGSGAGGGSGGGGGGSSGGGGGGQSGPAGGGSFMDALAQIESGNRNIYSRTDPDTMGPNTRSQGFFQIETGTWRQFGRMAGIDLEKYPRAMLAPYEIQKKVAELIPLARFGPRTRRMLMSRFGNLNTHTPVGKLGPKGNPYGGYKPGPVAHPPPDGRPDAPVIVNPPTTPRVTPSPSVTNSSTSRTSSSTSSSETHIGAIHVSTQATDAAGIAKELPAAIKRSSFASQANSGPE